MKTLTLIRGLPGSGKTTLGKAMCYGTSSKLVEADQYFERPDGAYAYDQAELANAHDWCQGEARRLLESIYDVVVANTFTRVWEMQPYIDMAAELGVELRVITARGNFESTHGVPDDAIMRMRERWEAYP